jgi:predicted metal-dependent peptidase
LSAEEIYPLIAEEADERSIDRHITGSSATGGARSCAPATADSADTRSESTTPSDAGDSWDDAGDEGRTHGDLAQEPRDLLPSERDALEMAWRTRAAAAAQRARESGRLSGSWARFLERAIEPPLPWRVLLARFMMSAAREDYSFSKLSRRDGDAILPRVSDGHIHVCAALDTSGSIASQELASFAAELDALKAQIRARVTVLACDERLDERSPWVFEPWEPLALPRELSGGAGTSFVPVFDWIDRCAARPDALVYFTDAEGDFPDAPPDYPVLWLVKGRAQVPWGERIQLN